MRKRILSLILCCALLSGCTAPVISPAQTSRPTVVPETTEADALPTETVPAIQVPEDEILLSLNDPAFLTDLEEQIYIDLVTQLDSSDCFVENVDVIYISQEYLEELEFNSQSNVFFGYTLDELNALFEGKQYIFTLGENGETVVQEMPSPSFSYPQLIKPVVIGGGIILICVTLDYTFTGGVVTTTVLALTKEAGKVALRTGAVKFVSTLMTQLSNEEWKPENLDQIVADSSETAANTFIWSALQGTLNELTGTNSALTGPSTNGLSSAEAAQIQQETGLPLEFIKNFHSMAEYQVYRNANLESKKVNGQWAFVRDIDWDFLDEEGRTNAQRVQEGLSPLDPEGESYELHHIGQRTDSPLAILTSREHEENFAALHANTGETEGEQPSQGSDWTQQRRNFWKALLEMYLAENV